MPTFIALFRGLNVGGHHAVKMAELRELFAEFGLEDVRSYIQSGNIVFRSGRVSEARLETKLAAAFTERFGFEAPMLVRSAPDWGDLVDRNPYAVEAEADGSKVHAILLRANPKASELDALKASAGETDRWTVGERALYLHTPDGLSRSPLAARLPRCLATVWTQRNWRTVLRLAELMANGPR